MPEQKEVHNVVEEEVKEGRSVPEVDGGSGEDTDAEVSESWKAEELKGITVELEEAVEPEAPEAVVEEEVVEAEAEATEEEIQQGLSALKDALMPQVDDEPTLEEISEIHALQAKHGMAGSRNAVKIDKNRDEVKGQRPGMRIGQPTRHYLTANSPKVKEKPLGKGAFKIDPNRPINN